MFDSGYLKLGTIKGVPVSVHWSIALGALVFGGLRFAPAFWLAFFLLILIHELGHAFLVKRYRLDVIGVEIHGFGGACHYSGYADDYQRSVIAWGGVLAQGVLLLVTLAWVFVIGAPQNVVGAQLVSAFVWTNLWIIGLNLLPFPPLDGARAWRLIPQLKARFASGKSRGRKRPRVSASERVEPDEVHPPKAGRKSRRKGSVPPPDVDDRREPSERAQAELAELFRKIGEQAHDARTGKKKDDERVN